MYNRFYGNIAKGAILVAFMLTIGTVIHEYGHVIAVILTGGELIDVEYHLTYACTVYEGGNLAFIAISGPIIGTISLLIFAKCIGYKKEWISRAVFINLTASSHDFAYFGLTSNIWFFIISLPCLYLVTKTINEFYDDFYTDLRIKSYLKKYYNNSTINSTISADINTIEEKEVSISRRPIQNY